MAGRNFAALAIAFAILLSGCSAKQVKIDVPNLERSGVVALKDLRPKEESQGKIFSLSISNKAYAIYRLAENASSPTPLRLLQHRAYEKFGALEQGGIEVHHLVIYANQQAQLRRTSIGAVAGGVGAVIGNSTVTAPDGTSHSLINSSAFNAVGDEEYTRAAYTTEENPGSGSVYVLYVDTTIADRRVTTRTVAPMTLGGVAALESALQFHFSQY